jgi:uncharacterized LabA/DUF88 family protein
MGKLSSNTFAFIDGNNLWRGMENVGWRLDYQRFRVYLTHKYGVRTAYIFLGFLPGNEALYRNLQLQGYVCMLKETIPDRTGKVKGNCDVDLTLQVMLDFDQYDHAVLVTSDGDFLPLLKYLKSKGKLGGIVSPERRWCSHLLTRTFPTEILFLEGLRNKLEYRKRP